MRNIAKIYRRGAQWLSLVIILLVAPLETSATAQSTAAAPAQSAPSGLAITQIKITGDEFLVIQNNTTSTISDLSSYWLYDFNNVSPLATGVSSSQQQLPTVALDAGQSLLLSTSPRNTCGAQVAGKLSVSLTDGGGFLELVQLGQDTSGAVQQKSGDVVSWSSGANGIIPNVPTSTKDPQAIYYRFQNGTNYGWQLADLDTTIACQLNVVTAGVKQLVPSSGLVPTTTVPPTTIVSVAAADDGGDAVASLPPSDIGLSAPQVNELLANPTGTDNDDTDEFIELYNPNGSAFDLSGFVLQTGLTSKHSYTFPAGTTLASKSFTAFYSADTGLSLSNTSGQAALLDPLGTAISKSDAYGTAKDGVAWAFAKGNWYWTSDSTPNAANVIKQVATTAKKSSSKSSTSKSKSTASGSTKGGTNGSNSSSAGGSAASQVANVTPIHLWTLAVVAALAVAYGVYEYRLDLANRFYEFRKHRKNRSRTRFAVTGR